MNELIVKLNNKLKPYHSLLTMLVFFFMLFIGAYKFIISPSDLRIIVDSESISYPSSIGRSYDKVHDFVIKKGTLANESSIVFNFLIKTTDLKKITLKNTSSQTLRGVKFKQLNTEELTAWSISTNFLTNNEELTLRDNLAFDKVRGIVYFKTAMDIPPNSQININIWGNFKPALFGENLIINYDGGEGHIQKTYTISGLKGYLVNYSFEFIVIFIFIFISVYYVGIKNIQKNVNN